MMHPEYHRLACDLLSALPGMSVAGFHVPTPDGDRGCRGRFALVVLSDGSVGPFHCSLDTLHGTLRRMAPDPSHPAPPIRSLIDGFLSREAAPKALDPGPFNALSSSTRQWSVGRVSAGADYHD